MYLKTYAAYHGRRLDDFLCAVIRDFLRLRPYERGLNWRVPVSHRSPEGIEQEWKQINIALDEETRARLNAVEEETGHSKASILYTALIWFVKYLRPPVPDVTTFARSGGRDHA